MLKDEDDFDHYFNATGRLSEELRIANEKIAALLQELALCKEEIKRLKLKIRLPGESEADHVIRLLKAIEEK